ncbi:hypothetical protein [Ferruginibacter sp. SUN106]|uniref:hypothetical protein n=1 Tax=Ferruginibacter sp. SUN106 TaxID=2978348 RepID=UPI003D35EABA
MKKQFDIKIDYDGCVTLKELTLIINQIEYEIETYLRIQINLKPLISNRVQNHYLQIKNIREGSLIIGGLFIIGGFSGGLVVGSLKKGFEKSLLAKRLEKTGENIGNKMDSLLDKIEKSLTRLAKKLKSQKSGIKKISFSIKKEKVKKISHSTNNITSSKKEVRPEEYSTLKKDLKVPKRMILKSSGQK